MIRRCVPIDGHVPVVFDMAASDMWRQLEDLHEDCPLDPARHDEPENRGVGDVGHGCPSELGCHANSG